MTNTSRVALRMSAAATLAAMALCSAAHAEYRCSTPGLLLLEERKACELARESKLDALIHFVHRTKGTYNLYIYDYVNDQEGSRWGQARHNAVAHPTNLAKAKTSFKKTETPH